MVSKPWAVAVVAAGAAAVVGRSAWIGGRLQEQMEAAATRLPAEVPVVRLIGKTYERGLFSSTQTVSFEFGCPAVAAPAAGASAPVRVAAVQLTARHRIQHGPFPGFRSVGAATIDSHLVAPEASRKRVAELFGDKAPVSAHTRVALSGAYDSRVTVPAFSHKLPTGGQLRLAGPAERRVGQRLGARRETALRDDPARPDALVEGRTYGGGHGREAQRHEGQGRLRRRSVVLAVRRTQRERVEAMSIHMKGKALEAASTPPMKMSFSALKSVSDTTIERDLLGMTMRMTGSGSVGETKLERLEMQASMRRLNVPAHVALLKEVMNPALLCADKPADPQAMRAQLTKGMGALLLHSPEYALDKLAFEIDGKRGEVSYAVGVEGVTEADLKQPMQAMLMSKATVSGQAKLPVAWIQKLVAGVGGERGAAAAQPEMINAMLDQVAGKGLIVRDGEFVSSRFEMAQGRLSVNGKPLGAGLGAGVGAGASPAVAATTPDDQAPEQKR